MSVCVCVKSRGSGSLSIVGQAAEGSADAFEGDVAGRRAARARFDQRASTLLRPPLLKRGVRLFNFFPLFCIGICLFLSRARDRETAARSAKRGAPEMRIAVSFTGGKDSVLATHLVLNDRLRAIAGWTGERDILEHVGGGNDASTPPTPTPLDLRGVTIDVAALVTFAPPAAPEDKDNEDDERGFKAHPLRLVRAQAAALSAGIAASANANAAPPAPPPPPFLILDITPPHADTYAVQLAYLRETHGIEALVTGDVLDVCSGFMAKACNRAGVRLITPLWQQPRPRILSAIHALGIRALITCVDVSKFPAGGPVDPIEELLGREITPALWQHEGGALSRASRALGVDLCGEGGEYHTAAFEAPHLFAPRSKLCVELKGHAVKGGRHAHVLLGERVGGDGSSDEGTPRGGARGDEATRIG